MSNIVPFLRAGGRQTGEQGRLEPRGKRFELVDAPDFRISIEPKPENVLRLKSQVMADKPVTVRRERIGRKIGRLGDRDMARLGIALAFVLGLAD
jgi:mRNA interferase MazF